MPLDPFDDAPWGGLILDGFGNRFSIGGDGLLDSLILVYGLLVGGSSWTLAGCTFGGEYRW